MKIEKEQIEKWKKQHGKVFEITVDDKHGYLKKPDRNVIKLAYSRIAVQDPIGACEVVLQNCWLGGDEELKGDDYIGGMVAPITELLNIKEGHLKNC